MKAVTKCCAAGAGWRSLLVGLLLFAVVATMLVLGFRSLGVWVAAGAVVPIKANVIVALGGDDGYRAKKVAELFRAGYADTVLITGLEGSPERERAYYLNWRAKVLADAGVTVDRLVVESVALNSFEEARATLALLQTRAWDKALIVSDPPHMRRLDWVWGRVFAGSGKSYVLVASEPAWWDAEHWWRNEKAGQFVLTELIKMGYYVVKY